MADSGKHNVENIYKLVGLDKARSGFLLRITIPPGTCTTPQNYNESYFIYPLTDGTLEVYENDKMSVKELKVGEFYLRPIESSKEVSIKVCNPEDAKDDIVILKG